MALQASAFYKVSKRTFWWKNCEDLTPFPFQSLRKLPVPAGDHYPRGGAGSRTASGVPGAAPAVTQRVPGRP